MLLLATDTSSICMNASLSQNYASGYRHTHPYEVLNLSNYR